MTTAADRLLEVAAAFGAGAPAADVALVYAPLVARVHGAARPALEAAVELVYEGYLAHYRTSRVLPSAAGLQVRLLAGDYFYAHGLRDIAATGDTVAVGLLTRLMGACAALRVEGAPLAVDDDLWEMTVAAVAAGGDAPARASAATAFGAVEASARAGDWTAVAAAAAAGRLAAAVTLVQAPCPPDATTRAKGA